MKTDGAFRQSRVENPKSRCGGWCDWTCPPSTSRNRTTHYSDNSGCVCVCPWHRCSQSRADKIGTGHRLQHPVSMYKNVLSHTRESCPTRGAPSPSYFFFPTSSPLPYSFEHQFSTLFPVPDFKQLLTKSPEESNHWLGEEEAWKVRFKSSLFPIEVWKQNQGHLHMSCLRRPSSTVKLFNT